MTDGLMRVWRWTDNCAAQLPKLNIRNSFASLENCIGHRAQQTKGLLSDPRWSTGGDGVSHWPGRVRLQTAGQEMVLGTAVNELLRCFTVPVEDLC